MTATTLPAGRALFLMLLAAASAGAAWAEDADPAPATKPAVVAAAPAEAETSSEGEKKPVEGEKKPEGEKSFKLYWKNGRTTLETDNFMMELSNRIQFRYTYLKPDDSLKIPGTENPGDGIGSFRIRRAKTKLDGWFWKKELTYELQLGWAGSDSTGGSSTFSGLEDADLNWDVSKNKTFQIKIGQFKVPFGRQELTSSENQQFVDRSILSGEFTHSRDVGIQLGGLLAGGKFEYRVGMFNGNGRNKPNNDNSKYQYDARIMYQPWGDTKYSESDFESKDHPLLAIAAEFENNNQFLANAGGVNNFDDTTFGFDAVFKYKGASVYAEYFARKREPEVGSSFHSPGFQVQAGYFLQRNVWEVAFRYATWDPSDQLSNDNQNEIGGTVNRYILKHDLKVQADFRQIEDKTQSQKNKEFRVQTQFVF
jgi:phosphate-selective porin OprO/OprP